MERGLWGFLSILGKDGKMIRRTAVLLFLASAVLAAPWAVGLGVGDMAPPLVVTHWSKLPLNPVFDPSHLTVVEHWATTCPYCVRAIPHLTLLQDRYKYTVRIVGVTWQESAEIDDYVASRGFGMEYSVACDGGRAAKDYGVSGIPNAFIVDQGGRIVWRGHPDDIDAPLAAAVDAGLFIMPMGAKRYLNEGGQFSTSVTLVNNVPVTYAWTHNGHPVGGNSPTLNVPNVTQADEGVYVCTVSRTDNPSMRREATLTLEVLAPGDPLPTVSPWALGLLAGGLALAGAGLLVARRCQA
jgi:thiol-disulfide isomerase/thioredoxin